MRKREENTTLSVRLKADCKIMCQCYLWHFRPHVLTREVVPVMTQLQHTQRSSENENPSYRSVAVTELKEIPGFAVFLINSGFQNLTQPHTCTESVRDTLSASQQQSSDSYFFISLSKRDYKMLIDGKTLSVWISATAGGIRGRKKSTGEPQYVLGKTGM